MPLFSRFKSKGAQAASKSKNQSGQANGNAAAHSKPRWESSWSSKVIDPEEIAELVHVCTAEMKSRAEALDAPFLLLPFRPDSDPSSARTLIRNFYKSNAEGSDYFRGTNLQQELRLTESIVLCSVMKWCWARMPGGVVTWPVYEGFKIGEQESHMARNAFDTFVPISAESSAHRNIIFDFFDLLAAVAAHGKMNGLGGRKLSRLAGWWAFAHVDDGNGFEAGYRSWEAAADATSHLFFAYLRSLSPDVDPSMNVIERIPRSLQALLASTEYPPETPTLLQRSTPCVIMVVDNVSPTPFALLRRAKHFEYRADDTVLREYQEFEDPLDALTEENKRVLYAISSTNSSAALSRHGNLIKPQSESWSAFQNLGFSDLDEKSLKSPTAADGAQSPRSALRSEARSRNDDHARPTTPSWADFLSSGFQDDDAKPPPTFIMPPDQVLPPIGSRTASSMHPSHIGDDDLTPGELAAIKNIELDDAFWWVWMTSLAGEEPAERKAVFGRCVLVETNISNGRWLIMEEQVKGASPDPAEGAYIAPRKSFFSFTRKGRLGRKRSTSKRLTTVSNPLDRTISATPSKTSLAPDQHSKIKAAAAALARKQTEKDDDAATRRGRLEDSSNQKTSSMLTVGMMSEATPAMKWASAYDKNAIRSQYLGDNFAGKGMSRENLISKASSNNLKEDPVVSVPPTQTVVSEPPVIPTEQAMLTEQIKEDSAPAITTAHPVEHPEVPAPAPVVPATLPMPPAPPIVPTGVADHEQSEDEGAPIANIPRSPMEKEIGVAQPTASLPVSRKPVPRVDHPALRNASIDDDAAPAPVIARKPTAPQNAAAIAAARAMEVKSTSADSQKLKKQSGGGIRNIFARRKENRNSVDLQRHANDNLAPTSESSMNRRLSMMRKKPSKMSESTPVEPTPEPEPQFSSAPPMYQEPPMTHPESQYGGSELSRVNTREHADAEHEFSRFDQGPIDIPAMEPQYATDEPEIESPSPQRHFNTQLASRIAPQTVDEPMLNSFQEADTAPVDVHDDAQSEMTMDDQRNDNVRADNDRWATIRENAAKRSMARQSEERSTMSRPAESIKTEDDGETSGEETIESRVARIKARVAELTGGIDSGNNGLRR